MIDYLGKKLLQFAKDIGIDPLFAITVLSVIISLSYWNNYKNWKNLKSSRKGLCMSSVFASIVLIFMSFLRLIGVINY